MCVMCVTCVTKFWHENFSPGRAREKLAAIMKIAAHMVGLQERMKGPRYDVFGPWPVCPDNIADRYPSGCE
jgi:hypothetical protein